MKQHRAIWLNKFAQKFRKESRVLLTAVGVAGCVVFVRLTGLMQVWELALLDQSFRLRPLEPVDKRIVVVGIDESDLRQVGQWPIPDTVLARLLKSLKTYEPRAIGLDLYRDLPVSPGHNELTQVYATTPNLIGIRKIGDRVDPGVPSPPMLESQNQIGFNNLVSDLDGKVRRGLLYWKAEGKQHQSFALKLSLLYLQAKGIKPTPAAVDSRYLQLGKGVFRILEPNDGAYINVEALGYQFLANPRGPANRFVHVSLSDVLEGRVPKEVLHDRIVLIGSTAVSLKDFFYSSYSGGFFGSASPEQVSGVELQANFISQILSSAIDGRPMLQVWSDPAEWLWIVLWSWIGAALSWRLRSPLQSSLAILSAGAGLALFCFVAFLGGWWLPLLPAGLALITSSVAIIAHIAHLEEELKRSKEFLNTIINKIPDPIFVKDSQHRWVVLNEAFCRFLGYSLDELLEKTDYAVFPDHEAEIFRKQDQQVFATAREQENEEAFTDRSGMTHQIATKRSLHKDAAGNVFLVGVIRDITERKRMEEELKRTAAELSRSNEELMRSASHLQHQATHDSLTGLPNRKLFHDRLSQAVEWAAINSQFVALLFLDLDGFKQINDSLGHDIGDLLLKAVAHRLTGCLRGSDTVSRLGGDEFTVILPAIPSLQDATRVADKILATLTNPFALEGHTIFVTTSIGISLYPDDSTDVDALIKAADSAMYLAKQLGKNRYSLAASQAAAS